MPPGRQETPPCSLQRCDQGKCGLGGRGCFTPQHRNADRERPAHSPHVVGHSAWGRQKGGRQHDFASGSQVSSLCSQVSIDGESRRFPCCDGASTTAAAVPAAARASICRQSSGGCGGPPVEFLPSFRIRGVRGAGGGFVGEVVLCCSRCCHRPLTRSPVCRAFKVCHLGADISGVTSKP